MGSQFDLCVPIFKAMNSQIKLRKFSTEKNDLVGDDRRTAVNHLSRNHPLAQLLFSLEVWTYFLCTSVHLSQKQAKLYNTSVTIYLPNKIGMRRTIISVPLGHFEVQLITHIFESFLVLPQK